MSPKSTCLNFPRQPLPTQIVYCPLYFCSSPKRKCLHSVTADMWSRLFCNSCIPRWCCAPFVYTKTPFFFLIYCHPISLQREEDHIIPPQCIRKHILNRRFRMFITKLKSYPLTSFSTWQVKSNLVGS